jgi:hypothetical protein
VPKTNTESLSASMAAGHEGGHEGWRWRVAARRFVRTVLAAAGLVGSAALACPVCAPGAPATPVQALIEADRAVLARSVGAGGDIRIEQVLKGTGESGELIDGIRLEGRAPDGDSRSLLLARDAIVGRWALLGTIDPRHADWLRGLAALEPTSELTPAGWRDRVARFLPLLASPEPLVSDTAHGEVARAPFGAMRANRELIDVARIRRDVDDPALASRRPLNLLLLGIAGDPEDARRIARRLAAKVPGGDPADVAALLAADLELRGASRLPVIEREWLLGQGRAPSEIQAALVALSVHGTESDRVPRDRIVDTYLRFIQARPSFAGWVAQDLATWRVWSATPHYVGLIASSEDLPFSSRIAILNYLRLSPEPGAQAAVERALRRK